MKPFNYLLRSLVALLLVVSVACVDENFKVKDTSLEVTVGENETVLPLAYMEKTTIKELFDMEEATDLTIDEDGNITYTYGGAAQSVDIEPFDTSFEVPASVSNISSEAYPALDELLGQGYDLSEVFDLDSELDDDVLGSLAVSIPAGKTVTCFEEDYCNEVISYVVPAEVESIKRIYFEAEDGDKGAKMTFTVNFNDLNTINGGGNITMWLKVPTGFVVYDEDGAMIDGTELSVVKHEFDAGQPSESFVFYLESIDNVAAIVDGKLDMLLDMEYHISFEMTTKAGELTLNSVPTLSVDADFVVKDADIVLDEVVLADAIEAEGGDFVIEGLPKELLAINNISFKEANTEIYVKGLDWLVDSVAEKVKVEATMPETLKLSSNEADVQGSTIRTNLKELRRSVAIAVEALDFGSEGLVPEEGKVEVAFSPTITAKIERGTEVRLTDLVHNGSTFNLSAGIDAMTIDVESISGRVDYGYSLSQDIEILNGDEEFDLAINGVSLSPAVIVELDNPMPLEALLSAKLTPVVGGVEQTDRAISVADVAVRGAEVVDGKVKSKKNIIVLAMADRKADYADEKYTFVEVDIVKLLCGDVPEKLILDLEFNSNPDVVSTVYATPGGMSINYDYAVVVPLQSRKDLDVVFEMTLDGFSETLAELSEYDIRVGDVKITAEAESTLPLGLVIEELVALDIDGNPTDAQIVLPEGKNEIRASKDGKEPATTVLELQLQLDAEHSIASIANVDGIRFKVRAKGEADERTWVNENQWLSFAAKLHIKDGITVDLRDFFEEEDE
ncbi:MAG: hypothetical protein J6R90_00985 [Alistipes sp.]|nr:hypothetical protein [Alistipes sp.]